MLVYVSDSYIYKIRMYMCMYVQSEEWFREYDFCNQANEQITLITFIKLKSSKYIIII